MMLGGLLGIGGNLLLYLNGLNITGPVDAFVIRTVQPIVVIALAVLILHVDFNRYKAIGIVLGLAGTLYVSITPHAGTMKDSFTGDILVFVSSIFNGLYLILIKPYTQKFNSIIVMRWMSLAAFILVLPFGFEDVRATAFFAAVFFFEGMALKKIADWSLKIASIIEGGTGWLLEKIFGRRVNNRQNPKEKIFS